MLKNSQVAGGVAFSLT